MDARAEITAVWRRESTRLVAALTRLTRDVGLAEDLTQDALVAALEQWPRQGIPNNPGAWLMTTAKRRAVDWFRRAETLRRRTGDLGQQLEHQQVSDFADAVDYIEDDVLRLLFLACHPVLTPELRAALTLRLVGGLTTPEIARGFLVTEKTMGQRISRAKRTLREAGADFEVPVEADRSERLTDVMAVIYLIFNEGYTATSGDSWTRPDFCFEGVRLARMLAAMTPDEPEVLGLQALLELQASRTNARTDSDGRPVLLEHQDRRRWDRLLIRRGQRALNEAVGLGRPIGPYTVQAMIAACHARAATPEDTDWRQIASLYDQLTKLTPNPVVEVNRAVAHGRAFGPDAGLAVLEGVELPGSPMLPAVRGDLLVRSGRDDEGAAAFAEAASLSANAAERDLLLRRARRAAGPSPQTSR